MNRLCVLAVLVFLAGGLGVLHAHAPASRPLVVTSAAAELAPEMAAQRAFQHDARALRAARASRGARDLAGRPAQPIAPRHPVHAAGVIPRILLAIRSCESGRRHDGSPDDVNWTASNARSSASGGYQVLDGTWDGYGGYRRAMYAPPAVQTRWALEAYRQSGTRPWAASRSCWRRLAY